jgi:hypothetical protein
MTRRGGRHDATEPRASGAGPIEGLAGIGVLNPLTKWRLRMLETGHSTVRLSVS